MLACALQAIHHEAVEEQYENIQMSVLSGRGFSCSVQADLFLKVCESLSVLQSTVSKIFGAFHHLLGFVNKNSFKKFDVLILKGPYNFN